MAQIETKGTDHPVTTIKLKVGERMAVCRCFRSKKFPGCDGSHRQDTGKGPAIVHVVDEN